MVHPVSTFRWSDVGYRQSWIGTLQFIGWAILS
jgi:hypothetical protein